jgi:hypothetical protein
VSYNLHSLTNVFYLIFELEDIVEQVMELAGFKTREQAEHKRRTSAAKSTVPRLRPARLNTIIATLFTKSNQFYTQFLAILPHSTNCQKMMALIKLTACPPNYLNYPSKQFIL